MTFSYNANLPNPPDDPGDDVAGMQTNTVSIGGLIAVDHVGFNLAGGGQHTQITFNANNVPTPPVSPPILFTNVPTAYGGTPSYPELFFYSGNSTQSSSQYVIPPSMGGTGSVLLMGGIILKWGTVNYLMAGGAQSFNFTPAFPNAAFAVIVQSTSNQTKAFAQANIINQASFQIISNSPIGFNSNYYYIAIGN
jgi:hypothetical protein